MADGYDYIERLKQETKEKFKRDLTPAQAAEQFALNPAPVRLLHLVNLQTPDAMTLRETAARHAFESAIRKTDATLRKVGR
jgi:hypothetical protein